MELVDFVNDFVNFYPLPAIGFLLVVTGLVVTLCSRKKSTSKLKSEGQEIVKDKQKNAKSKQQKTQKNQQQAQDIQKVAGGGKKKKKKQIEKEADAKTSKQLQQSYPGLFYGSLSLRPNNAMYLITAVQFKHAKLLFSTSKNELVMYDLKQWKKDTPCNQRFFTSLENNTASALAIGNKYYYAALSFDKTIAYFEFKGEAGVYFRQVNKFKRNIYKTQASSIFVPESQSFIVTTGSAADTVIDVWSMNGDRLHQVNTYQVDHYSIHFGTDQILVRGWTSEVKLFKLITDKQGSFRSLDKGRHLNHSQQIKCSAIDNLGCHALTICQGNVVKLWHIHSSDTSRTQEKTIDAYQLGIQEPTLCAVHTLYNANERCKTFVIVGNKNELCICNRNLSLVQKFEGLDVGQLFVTGSQKSAGLAVRGNDKMSIWNLTPMVQKLQEYVLQTSTRTMIK